MDRVCGPRQPNIIISKFRSRHNVSSKKISSGRGYNPLIDALNVENDVVFNTLVDQVRKIIFDVNRSKIQIL